METGKETELLKVSQTMHELWLALTDEQRELLVGSTTTRRCQKNDIIYQKGERPAFLFCILKGKVKIYMEGVGGRKQIVRLAKQREFFGYRAGFADGIYITEASALEDTSLLLIPLPVIKQIIRSNHLVAIYFIKHLAKLLGNANEQTVSLTQKHIRGRLAEALLRLRDSFGMEDNEQTLAISVSREDVANLSNMTTSNAIRTLSAFASEGLIAIDGRKLTLLDEQQLRHISKCG